MEFVSVAGLRLDGRRPPELRRLRCRLALVNGADGSAQLEQGNTSVLACVRGPLEPAQRSDASPDRCTIVTEVSFVRAPQLTTAVRPHSSRFRLQASCATGEKRRGPRRDRRSTEWSLHLRRLLDAVVLAELMPRSVLYVSVTVLSADGGARAAAVNAAVLALADAGVPMRDTCCALSATLIEGQVLLDPTRAEEGKGPELTLALLPSTDTLPLLLHEGARCPADQLPALMDGAITGARMMGEWLKSAQRAKARERSGEAQAA